jgi:small-conductance mechanosensitive channel
MFVQDFGDVVIASLQNLWNIFVSFIPELVVAFLVIVIGWAIAAALGRVVAQIIHALRIDQLLEKLGFRGPVERAGLRLDSGHFLGQLVKWFLILVFVLAAANILGLSEVAGFLQEVIFYIPNVVVAALILLVAAGFASFLQRLIRASVDAAGMMNAGFLGSLAKWAILILAFLAALDQLGVARAFITTLLQGFVAMLAIAGGLAFGLGGQGAAKDFVAKLREEMSSRN